MKIAIISDIHSNCFALKAVLNDFDKKQVERIMVLGDIFGYYPWAYETYQLLKPYLGTGQFIKGNHDQLLFDTVPPDPQPSYWEAAKQNEIELKERSPEVLNWLGKLAFKSQFELNGRKISMAHGTPANPIEGRYYPDNTEVSDWFPAANEIQLLGHTHYPLLKQTADGGIIFNPGSVGQARDGNPMPAWGILNAQDMSFSFERTNYDNLAAMALLEKMNWEPRAIAALNKTKKGTL